MYKIELTARLNIDDILSCISAVHHLTTGKVPAQKGGTLHNEMRHYVRNCTIASDGLFITTGDQSTYSPGDPKTNIVVPHNLTSGLLFHLRHNNLKFAKHLSQTQMKQVFNRTFYTWNLQPLLDNLFKHCY